MKPSHLTPNKILSIPTILGRLTRADSFLLWWEHHVHLRCLVDPVLVADKTVKYQVNDRGKIAIAHALYLIYWNVDQDGPDLRFSMERGALRLAAPKVEVELFRDYSEVCDHWPRLFPDHLEEISEFRSFITMERLARVHKDRYLVRASSQV